MSILTLQPAQPGEITYNVRKPLPYPYHIDDETKRCRHGAGTPAMTGEAEPWALVGFQSGEVQTIVLSPDDAFDNPDLAIGLHPVFSNDEDFFALTEPITSARVLP